MKNILAFVMFGLVAMIAVACNAAASAPTPTAEPPDDSELLRLVERIFSPAGPYGDQDRATVLVGDLPPDFDIQLPEGTDVIGSVINENRSQIVLDLPGIPQDSFADLTRILADGGWENRDLPSGPNSGGFVPGPLGGIEFALFCSESDERSLNASAFEMEGGVTDLRLHLSRNEDYSPCDDELTAYRGSLRDDLFPPLSAPEGAQQQGGGGGGGGRDFYTSTQLKTELSVQQVDEHYRQQLFDSGWTLVDSGSESSVGWSTWRFTDDDERTWGGMLLVLQTPEDVDGMFAYLRASRGGHGSGGSGSTMELLGPAR